MTLVWPLAASVPSIAVAPVASVVMPLRQWCGVQFHPGVAPMKILFLHGWTSTPGGLKPSYLKNHGHAVLNPALPDDDFPAAVAIAQAEFDQHRPDVVVGSSRGGAVAMNINAGTRRWSCSVRPGSGGARPPR